MSNDDFEIIKLNYQEDDNSATKEKINNFLEGTFFNIFITVASMRSYITILVRTFFFIPSLAVFDITIKVSAGMRTHWKHVIWFSVAFSKVGMVVTPLICTFFIFPGITVVSVSEWFWETSFRTHMSHILDIRVTMTHSR